MGLILQKRAALDWFNLFSVPGLALTAGFALYYSCGPVPGKAVLYVISGLLGVIGFVSNFTVVFWSAPDSPAHGHDHSH